jgi:amidohydrolase
MRLSRLMLACSLFAIAGAAGAEDLKAAVNADYPSLEKLYRTLHANPELSTMEVNTAKRLADEARAAGFAVTEKVGGTGIVAVLKNGPGPTLMLRTDMDALPVEENTGLAFASHVRMKNAKGEEMPVMHACGHDIHMTVWTGVARRMAAEKEKWSGTLVMIGQPAEETVQGAKAMLADGLFTRFPRPDFNLMIHDSSQMAAGTVGYVPGFILAGADSIDIEVKGIGGHGAYPHTTRDPVVLASYIVVALQTLVARNNNPFDPAVVTVGSIHGGNKHNIIGTSVHLQLSVRSYKPETRKLLLDGIKRIAENEGRAFGLPEDKLPTVTLNESTPATYNTPELVDRLVPVMEAAVGKDNVIRQSPIMASEDFSEYGLVEPKIPSASFWIGGVEPAKFAATPDKTTLPSLHSALWAPDAEPTIKTGVIAVTRAALDILKKNP